MLCSVNSSLAVHTPCSLTTLYPGPQTPGPQTTLACLNQHQPTPSFSDLSQHQAASAASDLLCAAGEQADGDQAVLCSVNSSLAVSGVDACPRGYACAALPSAFLDAAVGALPSDLFSGKPARGASVLLTPGSSCGGA